MPNTRVLTNKFYGWFVAPATAVADINAITEAEAASFRNISDAVKPDATNFNVKASTLSDDRSFADAAGAKTPGNGDFGGNIAGFKAQEGDTSSSYHAAETTLKPAGTDLIILNRPVAGVAAALSAGDEYNAYHVLTDAPSDVRGTSSYSWLSELLPQADMRVRGIVAPTAKVAPTVTVVGGTLSGAVGSIAKLKAVYQGVVITVGATWTTSDPSVATVSEHGIVERLKAGSASIVASFPGALPSVATAIVVAP